MLSNLERYTNIFSEKEILQIQKMCLPSLQKNKIEFGDIPSLLHIHNMMYGTPLQHKYIVIDEAQDYGLFHYDILKETFPNGFFSIYGDLAQSIYSYRSIDNWESVINTIFDGKCELINLNKSYRNTIEITNNANSILKHLEFNEAEPVIRHGKTINFSQNAQNDDYKVEKINSWIKKGYKTIAIICKNEKEAKIIYKKMLNNNINAKLITSKDEQYSGGVFVLSSALSKGLEFDAVIVNNASNNIYSCESKVDMHLLYVSCTRALHELEILYDKDLCHVFENFDNKTIPKTRKKTLN